MVFYTKRIIILYLLDIWMYILLEMLTIGNRRQDIYEYGINDISWSYKKKTTVENTLAETKYISVWEATWEMVWLCRV
jgi:hypothetical protein